MKDREPAPGPEEPLAGGRLFLLAMLHAAPVSAFILGTLTYWFAVADRYAIFLYGHYGATPFDRRTSSRYWMPGLVACGAVLLLYAAMNWFLGRFICHEHLAHRRCGGAGLPRSGHTPNPPASRVQIEICG